MDAAWNDRLERREIGIAVEGDAMNRYPPADFDPNRRYFAVTDPDAGMGGKLRRSQPELVDPSNENLFEIAHPAMEVLAEVP